VKTITVTAEALDELGAGGDEEVQDDG